MLTQGILAWIGFLAVDTGQDFLQCAHGGYSWVFLRGFGDFFITFHICIIFWQAAQAMAVFYRIPNQFGYFDSVRNPHHHMDEELTVMQKIGDEVEAKKLNEQFTRVMGRIESLSLSANKRPNSNSQRIERDALSPDKLLPE